MDTARLLAMQRLQLPLVLIACLLLQRAPSAQSLTGALIGSVKDAQGGVLPGATVRVSSPALVGGEELQTTNDKGQMRFSVLAPGTYSLDVEMPGFAALHESGIRIFTGATVERTVTLRIAGVAESVVVEGAGSRIEARDPGFGTRFGPEDLKTIPTRRASMFDLIRAAPGISPTSPGSGTITTVSAFGSGTNENQFLIDGTNTTCPCNGVARAELGVDFIQEIQVQSIGASVEFGNVQGAVINVLTRQGGDRFAYDASYFGQFPALTAQPVQVATARPGQATSGYSRARYRDFTTNVGGPAVHNRVWFFGGYQYLRDYDSQPGSDPAFPRVYEQDKIFVKVTWKPTARMQVMHSFHNEFWVSSDPPTVITPVEATLRRSATVPAMTFGHLTHTLSSNTVWDVRVGRFVYDREDEPNSGNRSAASRVDRITRVSSGAPQTVGGLKLIRTTAKATINHYRPGWWGADHQLKFGAQAERGEGHGPSVIPTGVRFVDNGGMPFQAISSAPSHTGGLFITVAAFANDSLTIGDRVTLTAGARFDHSRAISQDLQALDPDGRETEQVVRGLGTLYTWNLVSPRLGVTAKLTADGRTMLRGSYGRFSQGVLTGEFSGFHPGVTPVSTDAFDLATGGYTRNVSVVDSKKNLLLDPDMRAPHTDEYSAGIDREVARRVALAIAVVRKRGTDFIGWTDVGGRYEEQQRTLPDGRRLPVFALLNATADQRFLLTNPDGYSLTYTGLVLAAEKRRADGWHVFGSYTLSKSAGLQASSGSPAAAPQSSSVALPATPIGRDPNDLTNARGRLLNDRPHIFRVMGTLDVPRTGLTVAANWQVFAGKPWAATAQIVLPQGDRRVLIEGPGSRRLPSQSLLDVRLSRSISMGKAGRVELLLDVLNMLNDTAIEGLASDNFFSPNFGQGAIFMDPRRAMLGVRLNLGQ